MVSMEIDDASNFHTHTLGRKQHDLELGPQGLESVAAI